jgi:hypothetical protein
VRQGTFWAVLLWPSSAPHFDIRILSYSPRPCAILFVITPRRSSSLARWPRSPWLWHGRGSDRVGGARDWKFDQLRPVTAEVDQIYHSEKTHRPACAYPLRNILLRCQSAISSILIHLDALSGGEQNIVLNLSRCCTNTYGGCQKPSARFFTRV